MNEINPEARRAYCSNGPPSFEAKENLTLILELIGISKHDDRRALAEVGFLLQGPA